eukprot:CAMPEP_0185280976 /NCGR_PEP_ID=MMETSP1359-20130426/66453_1 /TAXON_ID=552665 /ORGANISM="Bigelowiella longifila, Strain CCMP242" /LENGTH=236 /DNA_ID=CAMNT_0027876339 /DNA_START=1341 /DNA_END=2051 /DNA_ORIENTATION=-
MTYVTTFYKRCIIYNEIPSEREWIKMNGGLIFFRLQAAPKRNTLLLEKMIKERTSVVWVLVPSSIRNLKKEHSRLASQFDLVVDIDPIYGSKMDAIVSSFVLDGYRSQIVGFSMESLSQRRALEVHMTEQAQELIKDYFMAARARSGYTFHELETIARVSRCHCRLHQRKLVTLLDVFVAIMVVEETMVKKLRRSHMRFVDLKNGDLNIDLQFKGELPLERFGDFVDQANRFVANL